MQLVSNSNFLWSCLPPLMGSPAAPFPLLTVIWMQGQSVDHHGGRMLFGLCGVSSDVWWVWPIGLCPCVSWAGGHWSMAGSAWFLTSNCSLPPTNLGPVTASRLKVPALHPDSGMLAFDFLGMPRIPSVCSLHITVWGTILWCSYTVSPAPC